MYSAVYGKPEKWMEIGDPWITTINHIQAAEEPDWFFHMHAHENDLEISYILHGKGALYCDGRFYEVSEGDIVIKNPRVWHAESSNALELPRWMSTAKALRKTVPWSAVSRKCSSSRPRPNRR